MMGAAKVGDGPNEVPSKTCQTLKHNTIHSKQHPFPLESSHLLQESSVPSSASHVTISIKSLPSHLRFFLSYLLIFSVSSPIIHNHALLLLVTSTHFCPHFVLSGWCFFGFISCFPLYSFHSYIYLKIQF